MDNLRLSERLGIVGTIDPQVVVGTEVFTDYIDMAAMEQVLGILLTGDLSAHGPTVFRAMGYSDTSGSDATEIKDCTDITNSATVSDNEQYLIGVRREDLTAKSSAGSVALRYVRFGLINAGSQTGSMSVVVIGSDFRYGSGSDHNLASVGEIEEDLS
jgi:hypothetical protein